MTETPPSPDDLPTAPAGATAPALFDRIGNYRILRVVGQGGMGVVYEAEQEQPVRRRVALKLVSWGMDTARVIARFESERQALALMDHPNIARVFDAGATEQGRPYFVMEYIEGVPITVYADDHRLDLRARLELFVQVCHGVQHAHHKGVIHRDLKPGNVLVRIQDGGPVPTIIDFGVAKATGERSKDGALHTELGQVVGTPEYMSPEQVEGGLDVDTRTDVYSLGVLLYELLTGTRPFQSSGPERASVDEIRQWIRDEEPARPSTRARLHSDSGALVRGLRGELDWITMKALEKDRARRYESPGELAADIGRHLRAEPVLAGPPTATYRLGKFVRRHRVGVAGAGVLVLALVLGIVGTTHGLIRARRAEASARQDSATAQQISQFLVGLFTVSSPDESRGKTITALELLDQGAARIEKELSAQPAVRAKLMGTIGEVFRSLALYDRARPLLEHALGTSRELLGPDHPDTLQIASSLGILHMEQGRFAEAEPLLLGAVHSRQQALGEDHFETQKAKNNLALLYRNQGRSAEAERLYREVLETQRRLLGPEDPATLRLAANLALVYLDQQKFADAEPLFIATLEKQERVLGESHPDTLASMNNLAILRWYQKRFDEAGELYRRAMEIQLRVLGEAHPDTLASLNNLAILYQANGRYDEAEALHLKAFEGRNRVLGPHHPETLRSLYNLACLAAVRGQPQRALAFLRQAVDAGWAERLLFEDADLASVRGGPQFEALAAEVRRRLE
ncbi:MAG TPA: serine/threonine-protein kinase [Candidatus Polarisedimenticolaceae bacterium]|nr:serine/threonine-protein kinase [Candidatus Polarisedimenticolaceae bacterium]